MKIDLIQPRHNYAPPAEQERVGHIYLPTSLLTVGSRLLVAGVDVQFHDENLNPGEISSDHVGFNLLGAPYIPEVMKLQERIRQEYGEKTFLVGGQVVSGLSSDQLQRLFGDSTHNGNDDSKIERIFGLSHGDLPMPERTSLVPAYERLADEAMKEYLSREFSLYVSQGCEKACSFCGADRTFKNPSTGESKKVNERYRDIAIIKEDLGYLARKATFFDLKKLDIYMSNLDVFQTPQQLLRFAYAVQEVQQSNPDVTITLRGLATVEHFLKTRKKVPQSIEALVEAGFTTVGFGVDGWGKEEWAALRKGHNTEEGCLEAIRSAREDFGITPEILMVFGNPRTTKKETIKAALQVTKLVVEKYGAIPRPHVSKDFIPGNEGWILPGYAEQIEALFQHPDAFQSLDFTALPSPLTHSSPSIRELATTYFLEMCKIPGNTTLHVKPITPEMSPEEMEAVRQFNQGRYDR